MFIQSVLFSNFRPKKILVSFAILFLPLGFVHAEELKSGLFVEPLVQLELGETTLNYPPPFSNSSGRVDGLGVGARVGFHIDEMIFLGGDVRYSMPRFKDSSVDYDSNAIATNWAATAGVQMPYFGLRLWGSYIFGGQLNPEPSGNFDVKFQEAEGYRVGAGLRLAVVSVNLEYQELRYAKSTLEQFGIFSPGTVFSDSHLRSKDWLLSVSFPFEL